MRSQGANSNHCLRLSAITFDAFETLFFDGKMANALKSCTTFVA